MYISTHYNSYYNSLYGSRGSAYGQTGKAGQSMFYPSASNVYNQSAFGSTALKYVQNIKTASAGLGQALKSLSSGSAFRQQGVVSADSESVEVKDSGSAYRFGTMASGVSVDRVATAQTNEGNALKGKADAGLSGYQQFAVEAGGKVHQFSFEAKAGETNDAIQAKMAQAINERGIGVTATVSADNGVSKLTLEANKTGLATGAFEIRDVAGSAVQKMGVGSATRQAQDAAYRLDGGELKYSASNTVDIGGGVTATLKKATEGAVSISRGVDAQLAGKKLEDMVSSYNTLYGEALSNTSDSRANNLFSKLVGISRTYAGSLADVGIGFDNNGYMTIDKEKTESAAQSGKLESFFADGAGKSYGFASQLTRAADDVQRNTNRYVSQSSFLQQDGSTSSLSSLLGKSTQTLLQGLSGSSGNSSGWMFDFLL